MTPRKLLLAAAAVLCTVLALVITSPLSFGLAKRGTIQGVEKKEGFSWQAALPEGWSKMARRTVFFPQEYRIYEDGKALDGILSIRKEIESGGYGRSQLQGSKVLFSTSDHGEPAGRKYEVEVAATQVSEIVLALVWAFAIGLWVIFLRQAGMGERWAAREDGLVTTMGYVGGAGLALAMAVGCSVIADAFLLRLGVPVIWAVSLALLATGRRGVFVWVLGLAAVIPAVATYIYYAVNGASHGSYQVAGILPMSDAWVHFKQAAQIALHGVTQEPFNGRFLFPAYFSSLLWLTGWNLSLANAVVSAVALLLLGLACWVWRPRLGVAGTALLALLCWLYFREFGSGQVMTEGLGLTGGLLGVVCLFLGCEQRRIPLFLLGVFWMSMASSARPGAMFALPLIGLSGGWLAWSWMRQSGVAWHWKILLKPVGIVAVAAVLVIIPFILNQQMTKALYAGKVEAFGNFSYTLNGLLTGSNWAKSYEEYDGNVSLITAENMRLMKTEPWRIAAGVGRAYQETFDKFFLFRFGPERRLAEAMKWLCLLGLAGFYFLPRLRPHAPWVWAGALGVVLSIPFAPPWDAEMRPYAATVPLQCLIPAAGLAWVLYGLRGWAGFRRPEVARVGNVPRLLGLGASVGLVVLIVLLPWGKALVIRNLPTASATSAEPQFRPGSYIVIGGSSRGETYADFQKRLAPYSISQGVEAGRVFTEMPPGMMLGINWNDLEVVRLAAPAGR